MAQGTGAALAVPRLREAVPGAFPGLTEGPTSERSVSLESVSRPLGRHQSEPRGGTRTDRQRHRGALLSALPAASGGGTFGSALPASARHRRTLLHAQAGLRDDLLRPE